jgi:hypothetical protein
MLIPQALPDPPRETSVVPFWFWNDDLDEAELLRQIADFEAHGVYGFVIHPRVGLPRDIGWMSDRMMHFMRLAVEEAQRRDMIVILYDEGMYPSGSSSGQVVATNPIFQCRCLSRVELDGPTPPPLAPDQTLTAIVTRANGKHVAVIDRPVDAYIRGLHYIGDGPAEDEPPAADILNPEAVATFIHLVYDRYYEALGDHFGTTIRAIFTDEPGLLGRCRERDVVPGTTGILAHVNRFLGYDFTPHLPALWYDDEPDAHHHREAYQRALDARLEETYYRRLHSWCEDHGIALTGHPAHGDEIGLQRYFHIPGQDLVWRWVLPGPTALEGAESTQAKCSASAALHLGRRRNTNECFGAYGHAFTWEEMKWLVDWCFVRGVNHLTPHAFYYSIRGPRRDERPPQVGPHSPWWNDYKAFADYCRLMCWLNTDSTQVCDVAILTDAINLPWSAAKVCFQHQRDFNYLELRHLWEDLEVLPHGADPAPRAAYAVPGAVTPDGIFIAGMHYRALIIDGPLTLPDRARPALEVLSSAGRLIHWTGEGGETPHAGLPAHALIEALDACAPPDLVAAPGEPDLRARHVIRDGVHTYILWNEGLSPLRTQITIATPGAATWVNPFTREQVAAETQRQTTDGTRRFTLELPPHTTDAIGALRLLRLT